MKRFVLTKQHITLLRHASVSWNGNEFGAPTINPKRPYGNSDVLTNIAEILSVLLYDEKNEMIEETAQKLAAMHHQTQTALQIILSTGWFEPGLYESEDYCGKWKRVQSR